MTSLPPQRRRRSHRLTAVVVPLALLAIVAGGLHAAKAAWMKSACQSNLHQIGVAIQMYAQDHRGRYPATLGEVLASEDISAQAFVCPASPDEAAVGPTTRAVAAGLTACGHCSYVYAGRGLTDATATAAAVVCYEPPANHGDGGNVLFGDGHAEWRTRTLLATEGPP